jgi:hypothetical protein
MSGRGAQGFVLGHDYSACGKMKPVEQEASGHDFSRAEIQQNKNGL